MSAIPIPLSNILKDNKGYYLVSSLTAAALIALILSPKNVVAWGLFGFFFVRSVCFRHKSIFILLSLVLGLTTLFTLFHVHTNQTQLPADLSIGQLEVYPSEVKINGNLVSGTATYRDGKVREEITFFYTLKSEGDKDAWESMEEPVLLRARFTLTEPEGARNHHQFDYQRYLYQRGIHWTAEISEIEKQEALVGWGPYLRNAPQKMIQEMKRRLPEGRMTDYLLAMLFNQVEEIDGEVMDSYRKIGVIHLFSISGMHVQFLIVLIRFLLLRSGVTKETSRFFLLVSIIFYGLLVGSGVGIFRAVLTNVLLIGAEMAGTKMDAKDAFACTILLALWLNPFLLFQISFQLSYGLAGILYLLAGPLKKSHLSAFSQSILLSFIMTIVSFPILSYHFFEVTWLGMFVNIIFTFFFSNCFFPLFWLVALLAVLQVPLPFLMIPHFILERALLLMEQMTRYLAELDAFVMITGRPNAFWYGVLGMGIIAFLIAMEQGKGKRSRFFLLVLSFVFFYFAPYLDPTGKVIHLDVGQGDAILFIAPHQKGTALLDTGGKLPFFQTEDWQVRVDKNRHQKELVNSLKAEGVRRLDAVMVTHSDQDHLGNVSYLANEYEIENMYLASGMEETLAWQEQMSKIKDPNFQVYPVQASQQIAVRDFVFEVLSPQEKGKGTNEDSLVLAAQIGGYRWLFTGDLDEAGERAVLERYPSLAVDFLKIGHHGSITSTSEAFLEQLNPKAALISVGKNNRYGHPEPTVIDRLEERKIVIFRTDQQGAIHFLYNQQKQSFEIMLQ
ncbi:DNA internalization-related competence protein ComEC/Rec2 [Jeotgalibaca caeni]|uniref:DNA internalization-related competence protein ComEC/Rec2 n=1 Tax=Jeotgalibaca caeni TaxID=3028623 RepID=UPI00237DDA3B|nr:DNA internalization-related competence protein ComEC/Rec2 [Jeotgalibaca caeni]MDE1549589.1 DNA internalization-related competence protein ComEC/Rec2 [Jeotgalibaca caeni]